MFDIGVVNLYGGSDTYGAFSIYFVNPWNRISILLLATSTASNVKTQFAKKSLEAEGIGYACRLNGTVLLMLGLGR